MATTATSRYPWLAAFAVAIVTCALYARAIDHPFLADDETQIVVNTAVTRGAPLSRYFLDANTYSSNWDYNFTTYRPLRGLAFRAVAKLSGPGPLRSRPFGVANLALYLLSIFLVLDLALRLSGDPGAAVVAAGLWALAPVHVETVVYASALGDQLSSALELCAFFCAMEMIGRPSLRGGRALALGVLSTLLAAGALFAKEAAVSEVGLLVLGLWLSGVRGEQRRRGVALAIAWIAVTLIYLGMRTAVLGRVGQNPMTAHTLLHGLELAPVLLFAYVWLCAAPLGHRFIHTLATPTWPEVGLALFGIALVTFLVFRLDRRFRSVGLRFGWGWFAIALSPVLHLIPIWIDLADRFALVASVGLAVMVAALWAALPARRRVAWVAAGAAAAVLAFGTVVEQRAWQSSAYLWAHNAAYEPTSGMVHANFAQVMLALGRPAEALKEIDIALRNGHKDPRDHLTRSIAFAKLGQQEGARSELRLALELDPTSPKAHALLGQVLVHSGRLDDARRQLELTRRYGHPTELDAELLDAAIERASGHPERAIAICRRLLVTHPYDSELLLILGDLELKSGDFPSAIDHGRKCVQASEGDPHCSCLLAHALEGAGQKGPEWTRAVADARAKLAPAVLQLCLGHP